METLIPLLIVHMMLLLFLVPLACSSKSTDWLGGLAQTAFWNVFNECQLSHAYQVSPNSWLLGAVTEAGN